MNDTNHVEIQGRISDAGTARQFERTAKRTICIRSVREVQKKNYETWADIALWGELASIPWLAAGVLVRVEGRLANESWKTQSGESRSKMVVVAASIVRIMEDAPKQYAPQPQAYGQYQQRYQQQQAHTYQNGQWVPTQTNSSLQPPAGVIPSPGGSSGGAASSSQAGDAQPDLPF